MCRLSFFRVSFKKGKLVVGTDRSFFGVSEVLFWVNMSCCCDASLLSLGDSSTSFWVLVQSSVSGFCSVLLSFSYSAQVRGLVSVLEKFDNFFKALFGSFGGSR